MTYILHYSTSYRTNSYGMLYCYILNLLHTEAVGSCKHELTVDKTPSTKVVIGYQHNHPWHGIVSLISTDDSISLFLILTDFPIFILTLSFAGVHSSAGIVELLPIIVTPGTWLSDLKGLGGSFAKIWIPFQNIHFELLYYLK